MRWTLIRKFFSILVVAYTGLILVGGIRYAMAGGPITDRTLFFLVVGHLCLAGLIWPWSRKSAAPQQTAQGKGAKIALAPATSPTEPLPVSTAQQKGWWRPSFVRVAAGAAAVVGVVFGVAVAIDFHRMKSVRAPSDMVDIHLDYGVTLQLPASWSIVQAEYLSPVRYITRFLAGAKVDRRVVLLAANNSLGPVGAIVRISVLPIEEAPTQDQLKELEFKVDELGDIKTSMGLPEGVTVPGEVRIERSGVDWMGRQRRALVVPYLRKGVDGWFSVEQYYVPWPDVVVQVTLSHANKNSAVWWPLVTAIGESIRINDEAVLRGLAENENARRLRRHGGSFSNPGIGPQTSPLTPQDPFEDLPGLDVGKLFREQGLQ
jgi:hypothetical protein